MCQPTSAMGKGLSAGHSVMQAVTKVRLVASADAASSLWGQHKAFEQDEPVKQMYGVPQTAAIWMHAHATGLLHTTMLTNATMHV